MFARAHCILPPPIARTQNAPRHLIEGIELICVHVCEVALRQHDPTNAHLLEYLLQGFLHVRIRKSLDRAHA